MQLPPREIVGQIGGRKRQIDPVTKWVEYKHGMVEFSEAVLSFTPLWSRILENPYVNTGSLARPFAHSLAPLTCLLARSLIHSLVVNDGYFCCVLFCCGL